ncbi:hypothetical protein ACSX02_12290, partial [Staphylococcus epidermidis]|uniref:hypothetical protein n=1 Tax=Staphylococcus epidermidis TaxID=1282 RepID=UPI003EE4925E
LKDGIIDDDEVLIIRRIIYVKGGESGFGVGREEANWLFELNDAVSGQNNSPNWGQLFIEAISKHVLEDVESPNEIDDEEAKW